MGVYIEGMEMPKEGFVEILIRDDGTVQQTGQSYRIDGTDYYTPYVGERPVMYKAVPVPEHGRLIDADAYGEILRGLGSRDYRREKGTICDAIKMLQPHYAPTIIPAEEGE